MFGMSFDFFPLGLRLALAVLVRGMLGFNRDLHRKPAGVRTHALGSLGSAADLPDLIVRRFPRLKHG